MYKNSLMAVEQSLHIDVLKLGSQTDSYQGVIKVSIDKTRSLKLRDALKLKPVINVVTARSVLK